VVSDTEPTLEDLARDALRACLQPDAPLSVRVAAIPFVLPRIQPTPPAKGKDGKPTGFGTVHIYNDVNGETVASDDPPPGYVVPPRRGGPADARDQ
jgi:hypothetical protein